MSSNHDSVRDLAIHAGQEPDPLTGAVVPPIYQVSTFKQDGVGGLRGGYEYSRSANPTRTALEQCLAALEGGPAALAFASGLAAEDCLLRTVCSPGDHVLIPDDAYGGTYRLFARVLAGWGLSHERGRHVRPRGRARAAGGPAGEADLGRDADQPAAEHRRHPGPGPGRPRGGRDARGGQHVRLAVPAAAARPRRRRRGALDDQVPGRAFRRHRRRAWWWRTRSWPSGSRSPRTRPAASPGRSTPG